MNTKRFWSPAADDRRARRRMPASFYAVELSGSGRYLRRVENVSRDGLLLASPFSDEQPGQIVELELPQGAQKEPVRITTEVVYVTSQGQVGVRRLDTSSPLPIEALGGRESL
ncbi:MAG: hypothetical protein JWM82_1972 [Myxococcales bacterium]|jgi:hypothetical protein|nr:hypothetical protein [Myxococcales bacterium]